MRTVKYPEDRENIATMLITNISLLCIRENVVHHSMRDPRYQ